MYYLKPTIKQCGMLNFLSPCMLAYTYSILNYLSGSLYYCTNILSSTILYTAFFRIDHTYMFIILTFLNFCNTIVAIVASRYKIKISNSEDCLKRKKSSVMTLVILLCVFILLHIVIFDFDALGGKSSTAANGMTATETGLNFPLIVGVIVLITSELCEGGYKASMRYLIYGGIILTMAVDSVGSKRELFFALLAIMIVEFIYYDKKIRMTARNIIIGSTITVLASVYILAASIVRGYGQFGAETLSDAVEYVPLYAQSETFNEVVGNNFETPYHYATAVLSCNYLLTGKTPLVFGETLAKTFFIPIPRSLFNYKPRKMIDIFTTAHDPFFRAAGGSYPVSYFSEFFQNFHLFGFLLVIFFSVIFQKFFVLTIKKIRKRENKYLYFIPLFAFYLQFVRGAGFESIIIYSLMAFACMWLSNKIVIPFRLK